VKLYPAFQQYFRESHPPLLAIWEEVASAMREFLQKTLGEGS
jgi:hypothetical protein